MSCLETLTRLLHDEVQRFDRESTRHKRLHRRCQTAVIGLTACTTVTAGASLVAPAVAGRALQFAVLCLTAASSAVAAWAAMRRTRELWEHERGVYYDLLDLQRALAFRAACGPLSDRDLRRFFARLAAALRDSAPGWARIVAGRTSDHSPSQPYFGPQSPPPVTDC